MESQLQIKHIGYQYDQPQFKVIRLFDGKDSDVTVLPSPNTFPVEGRPDHNLQDDLRWYLEKFLELPLGGYIHTAEQIQTALDLWGKNCFNALFQGRSRDWFQDARRNGLKNLRIKVASEDPRILAWPWEALIDPEGGTLAHHCRIERQLNQMHDPLALPDNLPADRINILLVIARPYGDSDVGFHALSRRMVELSRDQSVPVHIDVLRPPTLERLRQTLYDKPGFYHIVHFDGHGGYDEVGHPVDSTDVFKGTQGMLIFEDNQGESNEVEATVLSTLMAEYQIPIMVLNACQSAMIDEQADDAFASVAASLLRAGIRSVVAMGYNLYVSGAQEFVPAFYQRLLSSGNVGEATRAGRQAMLAQAKRVCMLGEHELQDWLVPVLYQQDFPGEERILPEPVTVVQEQRFVFPTDEESTDTLPDEILRLGDYGLIGRGQAIHALEKALRQPAAGMLVHGMAGVGKTTLAKGFVHWLSDTGGLDETLPHSGVFWFGFDGIHSVESVLNQVLEPTYGFDALAAPLEKKYEAALRALRDNRFLLIWDNFESVSGIPGTEVSPLLDDDNRGMLERLLADLQGGKTKVLVTSRSPERWLNQVECYRLPTLDGLRGDELWAYCNAVVSGLGLSVKRDDEDFKKLIEELDGNPLAIRAILLRLPDYSAKVLLEDLKEQFVGAEGDESTKRIMAALAVFDRDLPEEWEPVLRLIGLYRGNISSVLLEQMLENIDHEFPLPEIINCLDRLELIGLLNREGKKNYQLFPVLTTYLNKKHPHRNLDKIVFSREMSDICFVLLRSNLDNENYHRFYSLNLENLHQARSLIMGLNVNEKILLKDSYFSIMQSIAMYHFNTRNFESSFHLYESSIEFMAEIDDKSEINNAYHEMGVIKQEQRDFNSACKFYKKSLDSSDYDEIFESNIGTYHQLGVISQERGDYKKAKKYHLKALHLSQFFKNEKGESSSYYELGMVSLSKNEEKEAKDFFEKSELVLSKPSNEGDVNILIASGNMNLKNGDFEAAELNYKKALAISKKSVNAYGSGSACHQIGILYESQEKFTLAEEWYKKSVNEKNNNKHSQAISFHQLGSINWRQKNFSDSEAWFKKSLEIFKQFKDQGKIAVTYHHLGMIEHQKNNLQNAKKLYFSALDLYIHDYEKIPTLDQLAKLYDEESDIRGAFETWNKIIPIAKSHNNTDRVQSTYHNIAWMYEKIENFKSAKHFYKKFLKASKTADKENIPIAYYKIGKINFELEQIFLSKNYLKKCIKYASQYKNKEVLSDAYYLMGIINFDKGDFDSAHSNYQSSLAYLEKDNVKICSLYHELGLLAKSTEDFDSAISWYKKSLLILIKEAPSYNRAITYHQLGDVFLIKKEYRSSVESLISALKIFHDLDLDEHFYSLVNKYFIKKPDREKTCLHLEWEGFDKENLPMKELESRLKNTTL